MIGAYFGQVWTSFGERIGKMGAVWIEGVGETWTGRAGENGNDIGVLGSLRSRKDRDVWTSGVVQVPPSVAFEDEAIRKLNGVVEGYETPDVVDQWSVAVDVDEKRRMREGAKWVGGDRMVIGFTIFLEHGALRMSLSQCHLDSCSHPSEVAGLMTLCGLVQDGTSRVVHDQRVVAEGHGHAHQLLDTSGGGAYRV
jgi:hypothetical protein